MGRASSRFANLAAGADSGSTSVRHPRMPRAQFTLLDVEDVPARPVFSWTNDEVNCLGVVDWSFSRNMQRTGRVDLVGVGEGGANRSLCTSVHPCGREDDLRVWCRRPRHPGLTAPPSSPYFRHRAFRCCLAGNNAHKREACARTLHPSAKEVPPKESHGLPHTLLESSPAWNPVLQAPRRGPRRRQYQSQ